jgi:glycosyltransferase involved in cell wall biosynthesis
VARVAVAHNTLDLRGGADAVCLHTCEALARDHDVTLVTLSHPPLPELNAMFDTDVSVSVETPPGGQAFGRLFEAAAPHVGPQLPLRSVLLDRFLRRRRQFFDVVVSTANEFALSGPSVQYVHFPQFRAGYSTGDGAEKNTDTDTGDDASRLNALWTKLAGLDPDDSTSESRDHPTTESRDDLPSEARLLANSTYTSSVVAERYGRTPDVLHPPVDPISDSDDSTPDGDDSTPDDEDWTARADGVVILGRIAPDKRICEALRIVDGVRERGYDLSVHVVGSTAGAYRDYLHRVETMVAQRPHATLHRDSSRATLESLLTENKYGLSAKPGEHFGMAVAEYVAAGMVAFAPNSGGQQDVLDGNPDRLFDSRTDAVETVVAAVERGDSPELPRDRFCRDQFHDGIRSAVRERLQNL